MLIIWVVVLVSGPRVAVVIFWLLVVVGFVVDVGVVEEVVVVVGHGKQPWARARLAMRRMRAKVSFMVRAVTNCLQCWHCCYL